MRSNNEFESGRAMKRRAAQRDPLNPQMCTVRLALGKE